MDQPRVAFVDLTICQDRPLASLLPACQIYVAYFPLLFLKADQPSWWNVTRLKGEIFYYVLTMRDGPEAPHGATMEISGNSKIVRGRANNY